MKYLNKGAQSSQCLGGSVLNAVEFMEYGEGASLLFVYAASAFMSPRML